MEAPKIFIGGSEHELPPVSFAAVKRMMPIMASVHTAQSDMDVRDASVAMLAIIVGVDADKLANDITYLETTAMLQAWPDVMRWVGFVLPETPASGEAQATSSPPSASTI
jgi:hypothetical protein